MRLPFCLIAIAILSAVAADATAAEKLRALIVDGQNNHGNWPQTTRMMKRYLEDTGRFTVDVVTHAPKGEDPSFKPAFADYAVVVSNFGHGAAAWPAETRTAFEEYVRGVAARQRPTATVSGLRLDGADVKSTPITVPPSRSGPLTSRTVGFVPRHPSGSRRGSATRPRSWPPTRRLG